MVRTLVNVSVLLWQKAKATATMEDMGLWAFFGKCIGMFAAGGEKLPEVPRGIEKKRRVIILQDAEWEILNAIAVKHRVTLGDALAGVLCWYLAKEYGWNLKM